MLDIIQGEKQPWTLRISTKNANTGKVTPLDLTGFVQITVCFKSGVNLITLTVSGGRVTVDAILTGDVSGFLTVAETNGMPVIEDGLAEAVVDFGSGDVRRAIITSSHRVTEKICA